MNQGTDANPGRSTSNSIDFPGFLSTYPGVDLSLWWVGKGHCFSLRKRGTFLARQIRNELSCSKSSMNNPPGGCKAEFAGL